ncbi:MAG TPA: PKD domain-containing protein, partial [Chitinophagaceae bacterium]|nr:PKD domain-containing protein [Chitinophagaceae bacterium]
EGVYVVTVCVEEIRSGQVIAVQRKDVQINIARCELAAALLFPEYQLCRASRTITIANRSNSPLIFTYRWDIYDKMNTLLQSSTASTITHTFPDTGMYKVKLVINPGQPCTDSTTAAIRVYPGMVTDFNYSGICFGRPTVFTSLSSSFYGTITSWQWDFGEQSRQTDISSLQNPVYTYPEMGTKNARLRVTDSKGCIDSVIKPITILDKPPIELAFRDTLICINDFVQLLAAGGGLFNWSPSINISNPTSSSPTVNPPATTTYYVDLDDNGCKNRDSVKVRVIDRVSLQVMRDTTICSGDTIQLRLVSDGFQYTWSPASQLLDPTAKFPLAVTGNTTTYVVKSIIGGCSATDDVVVNTVPYPLAIAGPDTSICYNSPAHLQGLTNGNSWNWSPASNVSNSTILNPFAYPARTTTYVFSAYDTRGCPKPGRDSLIVYVYPKMLVSAGNDTSVVLGQELQLNAQGGETYSWQPPANLSAADIPNPMALFNEPSPGIRYKLIASSSFGCLDSAYITVKVFATGPNIFVPTAFTPNNDGKNDLLRPVLAGIKNMEYFRIYNRWGQQVFGTSAEGKGWNGLVNGQPQGTGTFVWMAKAFDYNGNPFFAKGMFTLIR